MVEKKEKLFEEFSPVTTDAWMEQITIDLKGVPFEKKLVWRTKEGFDVQPFYREEDIKELSSIKVLPGEFPYVRSTKADNFWLVRQELLIDGDLPTLNEKIQRLLGLGITAVGLHFMDEYVNKESITALLKGVDLKKVELNFYSCVKHAEAMAKAVVEAIPELGFSYDEVRGSVNYNPYRRLLLRGQHWDEWRETGVKVLRASEPLTHFTCFTIQSTCFVNAGAYIYQELGYALATGADMLHTFAEATGKSIGEIAEKIRFEMGIGSNFFMEIAKFRATRWLWALIVKANEEQASPKAMKAHIHAETSMWNKTAYDAHVNLLRTQTEAMSAAVGGVNSLTVLPFNIAYAATFDEFSERIARNQQLLLLEESHLGKVVDPSGGSYYVENLTNAIAQKAWKLFLEVEEEGGFYKVAFEGKVQASINASNNERHKAVATRKENLLGTNIFPNFTEKAGEEKLAALIPYQKRCDDVEGLDFRRASSDFEELRTMTERSGKSPKVFMLTIGNLAMRLARSQFSSNFFSCAGYELIDNLGFKSIQDGVDAAIKANADIVVLCSSDDEYAEYAPQAFEALQGRIPLVVAGAPACMEELKSKGIEYFIHVKVNVLETLQMFSHLLGIKA